MSITRSFLNDFRPLFHLLEEPFHVPAFSRFNRPSVWHPSVLQHRIPIEFSEEGNEVVARAEVPGVRKEHLDIQIGNDGRSVTIEGRVLKASKAQVDTPEQKATESTSETTTYTPKTTSEVVSQPEFRSSFSRSFWLPQSVDSSKATAELEDGILTLRIPKREEPRGRRIPIF
ncbi:hypothetical protein FRC09_010492 [Ceratobasidium sp. 395]|nr:hypothetical protein FRC09_010492 [Ceratobasidium sp. 395]